MPETNIKPSDVEFHKVAGAPSAFKDILHHFDQLFDLKEHLIILKDAKHKHNWPESMDHLVQFHALADSPPTNDLDRDNMLDTAISNLETDCKKLIGETCRRGYALVLYNHVPINKKNMYAAKRHARKARQLQQLITELGLSNA